MHNRLFYFSRRLSHKLYAETVSAILTPPGKERLDLVNFHSTTGSKHQTCRLLCIIGLVRRIYSCAFSSILCKADKLVALQKCLNPFRKTESLLRSSSHHFYKHMVQIYVDFSYSNWIFYFQTRQNKSRVDELLPENIPLMKRKKKWQMVLLLCVKYINILSRYCNIIVINVITRCFYIMTKPNGNKHKKNDDWNRNCGSCLVCEAAVWEEMHASPESLSKLSDILGLA